MIQLFQPPFTTRDARDLTPDVVQQRSEVWVMTWLWRGLKGKPSAERLHVLCDVAQVWNDSLVILRELCYSVPEANRLFGTDLVLFLFTLMSQPAFFDHAVGLIEEILANQVSRVDGGRMWTSFLWRELMTGLMSCLSWQSQTFYIGQVPNLLSLLQGFSLRSVTGVGDTCQSSHRAL